MDNTAIGKPNNSKMMGVAIAGAVVALVVGVGIGYAAWHKKADTTTTSSMMSVTSATKAADLRANLVSLGVQHMDLTDQAIDEALDGAPGADASKADLISNGESISAAIGNVYGTAAQGQFQTIWNTHLNDFVKYAVADKTGDTAGMAAALADIKTNYTMPISKLLSGANPNLPEATLESAFGEHIDMTAQMIDDHVQGKYSDEAMQRAMAGDHIKGLMSTLAGAIVKQYPAKFQG